MATEEGFVLISSTLFDRMRQHCRNCDQFNGPLQDLSDGRVAPEVSLPNLKKRKVSQSTESTTDVSTKISRRSAINDTGLRPSLQPSGTWPSLLPGTGPTTPAKRMGKKITLALHRFLGKVPIRTGWRERQARLGLNTVQEYEDVVKSFCSRAYIMEQRNEPGGSGSGLIALGKHLANLTKASLENANLLRSFAHFQVLILLSYCEFLRQKGVSEHTIDELIQPLRARDRDRRTLLDTIPRIHRLIVDLVRRGWTLYRATELFFINALSISDLIHIQSNEAFDYILQSLSADTFAKYNYDDCLTPSYTIPGLIASQLRLDDSTDKNLLQTLYDALGYSLPDLPSSAEEIYKVHQAKRFVTHEAKYPNLSYDIQQLTNDSDQEPSIALQSRQRSEEGGAMVDTSALETPCFGGSAGNPGPELQLRVTMKVPDTAHSIQFAIAGNIEGLKYLFSQGFASPTDVSHSREFSLVRWALYGGMHNYKTVQFLLDCGAFVDEESYHHAWDYAYRQQCSLDELRELRCITLHPPNPNKDTWVEEQQFPLVHEIIFGISKKLLIAELDDNPDAVRLTDAMGRTALDWATSRAQLADMKLLIDRGSSVNTMDISGRTTILHAVDSHNDDALRIVLEAGANPNPKVPKGLFRSSPLTAASFGGLVEMVKLLLESGAEVDACNPEGRTALLTVARMPENVECADALLAHGADLGYMSTNGHSPLTTAIMYNNHAVLKLFINWCDTGRLKGLPLLPIISRWADAETMAILASSDQLKRTLHDGYDFTAGWETLRTRTDYDEELGCAFEGLLAARTSNDVTAFRTAAD